MTATSPTTRPRRLASPEILTLTGFLTLVAAAAILAPILAPQGLGEAHLEDRLQAPSSTHLFGTDDVGRDVLSQSLYGLRTSLGIAGAATLISATIGTTLGALAGWFGGKLDAAISFTIDVQASLPAFILALGALVFFQGSTTALIIVLALEGWEKFARIIRGQAMTIRHAGYVNAALHLGVHPLAVIRRHLLPGITGPLAVQVTLTLPTKIIIESSLSFLGLGIQPPDTSLGQIIGAGREYLTSAWWIALTPGLLIILIGIAVGILGDRLQDRMIDRE